MAIWQIEMSIVAVNKLLNCVESVQQSRATKELFGLDQVKIHLTNDSFKDERHQS